MNRLIRAIAATAGVAAIFSYAWADAMAAIDRALSNVRAEVPDTVPLWVQDEVTE